MNFDFSASELRLFEDIEQKMSLFAAENDSETRDANTAARRLRAALPLLSQAGYLSLTLGRSSKAESGDALCLMAAMEILAALSPSLFLSVEMSARLFGRVLSTWGRGPVCENILRSLIRGELLGAAALSEKTLNVENDPMETIGIDHGDHVKVTGGKQFVVNGPVADWIAVVGAYRDSHAVFLVKSDSRGLEKQDRLHTLGYDGVSLCHIRLNACSVPVEQVIIPAKTSNILQTLRMWENQILLAASVGMMKSSFEEAKAYALSHHSGGKPIVAYQEVAFKLAEMLTLYQTSRLLALRAAWMSDTHPKEAFELTLCAKVFCTESAEKIAGQALQILAGTGYQTGNPAERAYRCAKYAQIAGTSTEIARVKIGDAAMGIV